jgi:hypothetical protein
MRAATGRVTQNRPLDNWGQGHNGNVALLMQPRYIPAHRYATARRPAAIPGIGPVTASLFATPVGDIRPSEMARQFAAWLDLVPPQSPVSERQGRY